jgi:SAM-dependent methyltransferase
MSEEKRLPFGGRVLDKAVRISRRATGSMRRRLSPKAFPSHADGRVLLHLGCGPIDAAGFINVDMLDAPHIHVQASVDDLGEFRTGSVDLVYSAHCLEHFGFRYRRAVLTEWVRVLKPGGVLRISVPDFRVMVRAYEAGTPLSEIEGFMLGGQDYRLNFHKALFDEPSLRALMQSLGLDDVRAWDPATVSDHDFSDDSSSMCPVGSEMVPMSLNLEGRKVKV